MAAGSFAAGPARSPGPIPEIPELIGPASPATRFEEIRATRRLGGRQWYDARDRERGEVVSMVAVGTIAPRPRIGDLEAASRVDHAAVVRPRQALRSTTGWLLVTDRVQGEPLDELAARNGPVRGERLVVLAADLFAGLAAIHRSGIAHGRLDASHVVVAPRGQVRIVGLGLASVNPGPEPTQDADLRALVGLLRHVAGEVALPRRLAVVLDQVEAGGMDARAARDELLPPVDSAPDLTSDVPAASTQVLPPRPWWVRVLAATLVVTAIGGLILLTSSVLSSGNEPGPPTAVPDVVGLPLTSAQQTTTDAGFATDVQLQAGADAPRSQVLSQQPAAGADAPFGSRVILVVATGAGGSAQPE